MGWNNMPKYIDVEKLVEVVEEITWYHENQYGRLCEGSPNRAESWYRGSEIWEAIENAPTVELGEDMVALKEDRDHLLRLAGRMHNWIFCHSYDEAEAYKECGLSDEDNARLGYGGRFVMGLRGDEE